MLCYKFYIVLKICIRGHETFLVATVLELVWTLESLVVTLRNSRFDIQIFYILLTKWICLFWMDLRGNWDYYITRQQLLGFYNRYGQSLLRSTSWIFKYNSFKFRLQPRREIVKERKFSSYCIGGLLLSPTVHTQEWLKRPADVDLREVPALG